MFLSYFLGTEMEYFKDVFSVEEMTYFLRRCFWFGNAEFSAKEMGFCEFSGSETLRK